MEITSLTPPDWEQVCAIYAEGIQSGQATFEVEPPTWERWDQAHLPFGRLVARENSRILGWAALSPVSARRVYAGVAELSIYIAAAERGRGIGQELMQALIACAELNGIWTLQAVIFPQNTASIRLHERNGFRLVGRREKIARLRGVWQDTLLFERRSRVVGID
ncbi:MAG TPA: GNAT family N-acetyltransferase [Anaerolineaceae bacterium]